MRLPQYALSSLADRYTCALVALCRNIAQPMSWWTPASLTCDAVLVQYTMIALMERGRKESTPAPS